MRTPSNSVRSLTLALALLVPCLALLWFVGVPGTVTPVSYMLFAALLTALTGVAIITYSNAQATSSMAQLIHEADIAAAPAPAHAKGDAPPARPLA
jgi:hypothetical protein